MTTPDDHLTKEAADQMRDAGYPSLAAFIEANDPSNNPDIWGPDNSSEAIVNAIVTGHLNEYRDQLVETLSEVADKVKSYLSGEEQ